MNIEGNNTEQCEKDAFVKQPIIQNDHVQTPTVEDVRENEFFTSPQTVCS